jgi:hypothetical protein
VPNRSPTKVALKGQDVPKLDYLLNREEVEQLIERRDKDSKPLPPLIDAGKRSLFPAVLGFKPKVTYLARVSLSETHDEHVPRGRPVFRPSPWSLIMAKSYLRHVCEKYNAATAELIRHSSMPVSPVSLFYQTEPEGAFTEIVTNFGDLHADLEEVKK